MKGRGFPKGSLLPGLLAALAALALFSACTGSGNGPGDPKTCGTDQPDPDEDLVGCLIDEKDNPVSGVMVYADRAKSPLAKSVDPVNPDSPVDSSLSDVLGQYSFKDLEPGYYSIRATDSLGRSIDPQTIQVRGRAGLPEDYVLHRTGTIVGTVKDSALGTPLDQVLCYVPGKPYVTLTDSSGHFELFLPTGEYTVRCGETPYIQAQAHGIKVIAGLTSQAAFNLILKSDGEVRPPPPPSVTIRYDSVTGIVHLSWPRVTFKKPIHYWVRRIDPTALGPDPTAPYIANWTTPDTFATDVVYWPRSESNGTKAKPKFLTYNIGSTLATEYAYSKTWVDTTFEVRPPVFLGPTVRVKGLDTGTVYAAGDTAVLVGEFSNPFRMNKKLSWIMEGTGIELKGKALSSKDGVDTLYYPCIVPSSSLRITLRVTDDFDAVGSDAYTFQVKSP